MAKKKKPSKIKKILKALGKGILLGGAAYGASKLFGGRKKKFGTDAGFLRSGAAGGPYGSMPFDPAQGNRTFPNYPDAILRGQRGVKYSPRRKWTGDQTMAPDRDIFYGKKGGKVTGIAKRGFGRALKKK
jgi:hypothetical protein